MRRFLLAALLSSSALTPASACPVNSECLKYRDRHLDLDRLRLRPPVRITVTTYTRAIAGLPPRDPRALASFLAAATWRPIIASPVPADAIPPLPLRFVEPSRATREQASRTSERLVLIRQISTVGGTTYVDIDGESFALEACPARNRRSSTACLVRRDPPAVDSRFAQPPP